MLKHILFAFALSLVHLRGFLLRLLPTANTSHQLFSHCVSCHRQGEVGPFSLTNYDETKAKLQTIRYAVDSDIMPPWKPASGYGNFVGERRLTPIEKQTILNWIDAGAPEGDKSKMPNLRNSPPAHNSVRQTTYYKYQLNGKLPVI
ncbi:MAG: cytochrome c [Ignavibacteria bacterium]|nr:cytochrome c [Ignavibacteria bacterium]